MKKIGLMSEIFPPLHGGSGRWFSEIYRRFPNGSVVAIAGEHKDCAVSDQAFPHPVYRLDMSHPEWGIFSVKGIRYYMRVWRQLRNLAKREQITEVHCGRILPEGLVALMLHLTSGVPYVCYVHGEDVEGALLSRELTLLTRMVFSRASKVVCNSQNTLRILHEKWNATDSQLAVMTPGVDIEHFTPESGTDRPETWQNRPVVLTVSRLQKRKGQDMMIRALPIILQRVPDLLYVIVGGGPERTFLEGLCKDLGVEGHVSLLGELSDAEMVDVYRHCDVFALPNRTVGSDYEGFGMVLLEAQSCGTAVLAGDSGGTRETMLVGETGVLADCTAPEPLAEAMLSLLEDPERLKSMGHAGRRHIVERFGWDSLSEHALSLFQVRE